MLLHMNRAVLASRISVDDGEGKIQKHICAGALDTRAKNSRLAAIYCSSTARDISALQAGTEVRMIRISILCPPLLGPACGI